MVPNPFRKVKYDPVEVNNLRIHIPNFISNIQSIFLSLSMSDPRTLYTLSISNRYLDQVHGINTEYNIIKSILASKGESWRELNEVYISLNKVYDFNFNKLNDDSPKRVDVQDVNLNLNNLLTWLDKLLDRLPKVLGKNFDKEDVLFGSVVRGIPVIRNSIESVREIIRKVPNDV